MNRKLSGLILAMILLAISCVTSKPESFYRVVTVPAHTIHFCSDRSMFLKNHTYKWQQAITGEQNIDGFYDPNTQSIWILAVRKNSKIRPWSECLLGHELQHLLTYVDRDIGNPDNN